ncbi:MAG: hypothetical protein WKF31_11010 [Thermoleophilaceae bacterium]
MEAASTLPLRPPPVSVRGGRVEIDHLVVDDERLAVLVQRRAEQGAAADETVVAALEIGARVLDREATGAEVDFVKHEFAQAAAEVERSFSERAQAVGEALGKQLERFLGEDSGTMGKALDAHSEELAELVATHFGGDRSTAVQHQLRELMGKQLQESREALLRQFSAEDGHNPIAGFQAAVVHEMKTTRAGHEGLIEKLGALQGEVKLLRAARESDAELDAERERGTGKGRTFEEQAFEVIEDLAVRRGDVAHRVGDERSASGSKKGDVVIELEAAQGPSRGRIALELKDRKLSKNDAWAELNAALAERDAAFAILLVASEEKVPAGRDPLHEYEGNKMIVALDRETLDPRPLELAYRYARCRCLMALESDLEVDAAGVRAANEEALSALREAQSIKLALTGATKGVDSARGLLENMVDRVRASLERVEALLAASESARTE